MTKTRIFTFALIVGFLYVGYELLGQQYQGEGLGEIALGLQYIFVGIIVIPVILGILGFFISKEKRLAQALSAFGISLAVMLVLMLVVGAYKNMERKRLNPPSEVPVLEADSPLRKSPLPL